MGTGEGYFPADLQRIGKSIARYTAPVWSTNASDSSFKNIQTAQNAALRTATGAHKMASIDNLHQESLTLKVKDHSDMLSVQYLVSGEGPRLSCHHNSRAKTKTHERALFSRQHSTVLPRLGTSRKESKQNLHTYMVDSAIHLQRINRVLKKHVRHLFACTTHPTDLSPEDLLRIR